MEEQAPENIVKKVCRELNITQKELAEMLDVPLPTLARWAGGEVTPQGEKMLELFTENTELKKKFAQLKEAFKLLQ